MAHLGVVDEEELERVCSERETVLDRPLHHWEREVIHLQLRNESLKRPNVLPWNASWPDNPGSAARRAAQDLVKINSGNALLSPHPAPPSPPDPSYQEQVPPLNSTSKGLTTAATPVVLNQGGHNSTCASIVKSPRIWKLRGWEDLHPGLVKELVRSSTSPSSEIEFFYCNINVFTVGILAGDSWVKPFLLICCKSFPFCLMLIEYKRKVKKSERPAVPNLA